MRKIWRESLLISIVVMGLLGLCACNIKENTNSLIEEESVLLTSESVSQNEGSNNSALASDENPTEVIAEISPSTKPTTLPESNEELLEQNQTNPFDGFEIGEDIIEKYYADFQDFLTPEEYVELCETIVEAPANTTNNPIFGGLTFKKTLLDIYCEQFQDSLTPGEYWNFCEAIKYIPASPIQAINDNLAIVYQNNSTYDTISERYMLVTTSGVVIREFRENYNCPSAKQVGNYLFIDDFDEERNWPTKDIMSLEGDYISYIEIHSFGNFNILTDLGNEYYIVASGDRFADDSDKENSNFMLDGKQNDFWLFDPEGNCYEITIPYGLIYICSSDFGKMSDGMFSYSYLDEDETYAYYFDEYGQIAIDLSEETVNFTVIELGEFADGFAEITLKGVDRKSYTAMIDKTGAFVSEPTRNQ